MPLLAEACLLFESRGVMPFPPQFLPILVMKILTILILPRPALVLVLVVMVVVLAAPRGLSGEPCLAEGGGG